MKNFHCSFEWYLTFYRRNFRKSAWKQRRILFYMWNPSMINDYWKKDLWTSFLSAFYVHVISHSSRPGKRKKRKERGRRRGIEKGTQLTDHIQNGRILQELEQNDRKRMLSAIWREEDCIWLRGMKPDDRYQFEVITLSLNLGNSMSWINERFPMEEWDSWNSRIPSWWIKRGFQLK